MGRHFSKVRGHGHIGSQTTNTPALIVNRYTDSCPTHYSTLHCLTHTLCFYATVTTVTQVLTTTCVIAVYTKSDSSANKTRIQNNELNQGLAWLIGTYYACWLHTMGPIVR